MVAAISSSLRNRQHLLIQQLADCIEHNWAKYLTLSTYQIPPDLGYIEGSLEGEKLIIENRCYQTPQFRKLHLELAKVGDRLDILHCVMFPRSNYDIPIFGVDLVGTQAGIGAAIVDLSPTNSNRILSNTYIQALSNLPTIDFAQPRILPAWGDIFSPFCLFIRPVDQREELLFLNRVTQFLTIHCLQAIASTPLLSPQAQAEIKAAQLYYCQKQQQNDKTRKVLEKSLGQIWTDHYMKQMLFDCD
ncbi:ferredoxin-dependent bilin reductase [Chondrocystis sp. NIES-4102]|nr:ferredoxin-dependent bilin reductase [Chondrocystis sp. NIES-4102]